ncbi:MAG TPA: hypothetical protein VFL91_19520 [Thermomicrobiales bacterium]|nr:hypothetical protein [Thermomicrobiales bacterium]
MPDLTNTRITRRRVLALGAFGGAALLLPRSDLSARASGADGPRTITGTNDGAAYRIQIPANWNGTLVLYSQGNTHHATPLEVGDPVTGAGLLARGYALAGSAYSAEGYAVAAALDNQIALLDLFSRRVGTPDRTIAWGDSQGGLITAGLVQRYPKRFAGALPMCGLVMGGVAALNLFLDLQFALKTLLAPDDAGLEVAHFTDVDATIQRTLDLLSAAQQSPAGRARVALAAALGQIADYGQAPPHPAPTDYAARARNQADALGYYVVRLWTATRASAEQKARGNPAFTTGVRYRDLFARAAQRDIAETLYTVAGLDLDADLRALDDAPRIAADPRALEYVRRFIVLDGKVAMPILTLHTIGDPAAPVAAERAYADAVRAAGHSHLLRQLYVDREGHCTFSPAERLAAFAELMRRIDTGCWDEGGLTPAALNSAATALGPAANVVREPAPAPIRNPNPVASAFATFQPPSFLRPFDASTHRPYGGAGAREDRRQPPGATS